LSIHGNRHDQQRNNTVGHWHCPQPNHFWPDAQCQHISKKLRDNGPGFPHDTHPFGTIGVTLASLSLVVNIAFGILQVRAINKCTREDLESGKDGSPQLAAAGSTSQPVDVTNQRPSLHKVVHELDASEPLQCANPWFILLLGRKPANLLFLAIHPMTRRNCPNACDD
jgi:hypothetical protein